MKPNITWVSDFTYFRLKGSFIYLATIQEYTTLLKSLGIKISISRKQSPGKIHTSLGMTPYQFKKEHSQT